MMNDESKMANPAVYSCSFVVNLKKQSQSAGVPNERKGLCYK
jgi:hypothetical protein